MKGTDLRKTKRNHEGDGPQKNQKKSWRGRTSEKPKEIMMGTDLRKTKSNGWVPKKIKEKLKRLRDGA
jgi:hypothetical protein